MARMHRRGRGQPGTTRWAALGAALLVILGLTFGIGVLVGWHRARQTHPAVAAESPRKPTPTPRRGGLTEAGGERLPQLQEKLTFYQTLRAPLEAVQGLEKGSVTAKPTKASVSAARGPGAASEAPRTTAQEIPRPTTLQNRSAAERNGGSLEPRDTERADGAAWTVQVGVFSTPEQAAGVKKRLAAGGFEAQVTSITTGSGQVRYRVRVGAFRSKGEAVQIAERVRFDRSLQTYVTTR